MMKKILVLFLGLWLTQPSFAQSVWGNASLSVTTSSSNVVLPADTHKYPYVIVAPAEGSSQEVFYSLGSSSVAATTSSPALPGGGICVNVGPNTYLAAITALSTATLRITQSNLCPFFAAAGSSGGGGGSGAVYGPTAVGSAAANPPVLVGGTVDGTAAGNVSVWKVLSGVGFINCSNCSGSGISVAYGGAIGTVGTPDGYKDGSGNFQPFLGDVTNGQWVSVKASVPIDVTGTFWQATQPVSGTFWQATQPTSLASAQVASGAYALGSIGSGAMVDLGSQADAAAAADDSTASLIALLKRNNQNLTTLNTTAGSAIPAGTNLIGQISLNIAAAANSATNGIYTNLLQGNAVISATNGLFANLMVGNAAVATGTGAQGATVPRMTVATDSATVAGSAPVKGGAAVVNGGSFYQAVAASQTATVLQSSTGATGDYLSHCVIYPTSTTPGVVTVFDSTNTAANSAILFAGGASSVSNLVPFAIPVGAVSVNGAWKVTTGANVSVVCYGKFS